ncbi:MAG: hypothetical protein K5838_00450 [Elusimicrobiales bacterium]|nr:hypothetical protein [Elusimicrobiales bacterium]
MMPLKFLRKRISRLDEAIRHRRPAQAMTEVVLLFPVFMVILFITAKIFALLILVQKMEIASFYAARRWQLESHLNASFAGNDDQIQADIEEKVREYLGFYNPSIKKFLNLSTAKIDIQRTQVWNVVTLKVSTRPTNIKLLCRYPKEVVCNSYGQDCKNGYDFMCVEPGNHQNAAGKTLEVTKYVPSRDRPIKFTLPGTEE